MTNNNIFEVTQSVLLQSLKNKVHDDNLMLYDNFSPESDTRFFNYDTNPVKLQLAIIAFCRRGRHYFRINLKDFELQANDFLIIPPGTILDKARCEEDSQLGMITVADYKKLSIIGSEVTHHLYLAFTNEPTLLHFDEENMHCFLQLYELTKRTLGRNLVCKDTLLDSYMQAMAAYIANEVETTRRSEARTKVSRNEQIFHSFLDLVRQHYSHKRSVTFYANELCITPKYLGVVVTKTSGRHPIDWIRDYVILDAKAMLLSGKHSVQQVSEQLHFPNSSFFGKYFKEAVGCSPGKYIQGK